MTGSEHGQSPQRLPHTRREEAPDMRAAALALVERGFHILPVYGIAENGSCACRDDGCSNPGKHPHRRLVPRGAGQATNDASAVEEWWSAEPTTNIGIATRGRLLVVDIDGPEGEQRLREAVEHLGPLPTTLEAASGRDGGRHLYFHAPDSVSFAGNPLGKKLDIRVAANHLVVAPPSMHVSGRRYRWLNDEDVAELPQPWVEAMRKKKRSHGRANSVAQTGGSTEPVYQESNFSGLLPSRRPVGTSPALRALATQAGDLASMEPDSGRNTVLNKAAHTVSGLAAGGALDGYYARNVLLNAAAQCGLHDDEIQRTLESGWNSGAREKIGAADEPWVRPENIAGLSPKQIEARYPRVDWYKPFSDDDLAFADWVVESFIEAGRGYSVYAGAKVGKSLLMLEVAAAVAKGRKVLGCRVPHPRRVVYIDQENNRRDLRRRLEDLGYGPDHLDNLVYLSFPELPPLDGPDGGQEFIRLVEHYGAQVVVLDTFSRMVDGRESDSDTYRAYYQHAGRLLKTRGIAYVRLDHSGKDSTKGVRGSSAKNDDVDAVFSLRASGKSGNRLKLTRTHSRQPDGFMELSFSRVTEPHLRHVVDDLSDDRRQVGDEVDMLVGLLDELGVPIDWGRKRVRARLKEAGHTAGGNDKVNAAIQRRRGRDGVSRTATRPQHSKDRCWVRSQPTSTEGESGENAVPDRFRTDRDSSPAPAPERVSERSRVRSTRNADSTDGEHHSIKDHHPLGVAGDGSAEDISGSGTAAGFAYPIAPSKIDRTAA